MLRFILVVVGFITGRLLWTDCTQCVWVNSFAFVPKNYSPFVDTKRKYSHDCNHPISVRSKDPSRLLLRGTTEQQEEIQTSLTEYQMDYMKGYLNQYHSNKLLLAFVRVFSSLGVEEINRNAFSGGSFQLASAMVESIKWTREEAALTLLVTIQNRGWFLQQKIQNITQSISFSLDAQPIPELSNQYKMQPCIPRYYLNQNQTHRYESCDHLLYPTPMDDWIRRMNRLCTIVHEPSVTGQLVQLALQLGGKGKNILKENLFLNQVPHNRFVRKYFYDMASQAVLDAVVLCSNKILSNHRMKLTMLFPEMNPQMDSYRIGTLLELARSITIKLVEQNLRVRICVQGSMGTGIFTGIPKQLSGVATLLQRMDWQSATGEENEGILGNYVRFGAIGKEHVVNNGLDAKGNEVYQDDVFLLLCPQSMIGVESSIIPLLVEMTEAVGDRPIILLNADLSDKVSSQGQQTFRGRQERIEFADSFQTIFHFQNIYLSGTSYFPILGAVGKSGPLEPWVAYQRRDLLNSEGELYMPMLSTEEQPDGQLIINTFES